VNLEPLRDLWLTYQSTVAFIGLNGLLALSVYTTLACGQLSLAQAGFMALGAYTSTLLTLHARLPFPVVLAAGTLAPALVAVPLALPVLRLKGVFLAIATIGFGEVVRIFFVNLELTNGALGLTAVPQRTRVWMLYAALGTALFVLWRLRGSRAGYALEAIREDEPAARTMGVHADAYKLGMMVLGAAFAGLAGALDAHFNFIVVPASYSFARVVEMLVFAVVGGTSVFFGPAVGAAFLTLLPEVLREVGARVGLQPGPLRLFANGLVLLLVILFLPEGLVSLPRRIRERRAARRAAAHAP
jgi:branched-chain amino acid transport system permease protein